MPPGAVRAYREQLRRVGRLPGSSLGAVAGIVLAAAIGLVVFGSVVVTLLSVVIAAAAGGDGGGGIGVLFGLFPLVVLGAAVAVVIAFTVRGSRAAAERMYRLDRFAQANAMQYVPRLDAPALPGMIFALGSDRHSTDLVRGGQPRFVEFANYRYTTGSGKNRQTHRWGYVAIKLDTPLPHIVLDATGNNSLFGSNLPLTFDRDQRLSLEGDFDEHFALYCPAGYERDALYLFTPDIMARFIDNAAALDVEIVDDWLFLYARRDFTTLDPATWAWLFSVVGAFLDKFAQWARWRDERLSAGTGMPGAAVVASQARAGDEGRGVSAGAASFTAPLPALRPPPGVAPQGRRLQRGVPWVTVVVAGAIVLFWILSNSGLLGLLFR